jgi:hypothetical protein
MEFDIMKNKTANTPIASNDAEVVPTYAELAQQYKQFAKQSAENVIKLAKTVATAEDEFSDTCGDTLSRGLLAD